MTAVVVSPEKHIHYSIVRRFLLVGKKIDNLFIKSQFGMPGKVGRVDSRGCS
jgi:hypothetical protein